jgi:arylsulfatase
LVRAYDDAIRYTDGVFERLASDLGEEATVVVTADHGEGFGEHGTYGHHHQLYEENVHVPLVIADDSWQGASERPVSLRRLPDIVTSVASGDAMTYERDDGVVSISPDESLAGLRTRGWKYCQNASDDSAALFDLSSDPAERDNVADERDGATAFGDRLAAIRRHERLRTTLMETVEETVNEVGDRL